MALIGNSALVLWYRIDDGAKSDFHVWHGKEHIPNRLGVDGIYHASRYAAVPGELEYFTLFEAETPSVFTSSSYRTRSSAGPTPLEASLEPHFRPGPRLVCRVIASHGEGRSGLLATVHYRITVANAEAHQARMVESVLPQWMASAAVSGVHLLYADPVLAEDEDSAVHCVLLCEGWGDLGEFDREIARLKSLHSQPDAVEMQSGIYRLQYAAARSLAEKGTAS